MLAAAVVVSDGLGRGFDRAVHAADLPDVIVRFNPQQASRVAQRIEALPDLAAFSLRQEFTGLDIAANGHSSSSASVEVIGPGRRGYAIVAGRNVSDRAGEVVVERGLAVAWGVRLGGTLDIGGIGPQRVVGLAESPDNVSYPLASPRVYLSRTALERTLGGQLDPRVNFAQIWLRDPRNVNEVLVQARATSYGLDGVRFVTRSGLRVLLDQAAGIVIDLLVALSVIALATAGVMLAASARAEVQRRLRAIGVRRAVGASRAHLALHAGNRGAVRRGPRRHDRRRRRDARDLRADHAAADAAQRARSRRRPDPGARRRLAGEHRDPGARGGVAGMARGGARRRCRCCAAPSFIGAGVAPPRSPRRARDSRCSAHASSAPAARGWSRPRSRSAPRPRSCC